MTKAIRRAELVLIAVLVLVLLLPQLIGTVEPKNTSESVRDIASLEDLKNKTASVVTGSSFGVIIRETFPDASIQYVTDWADECIQVAQGKADFLLWEAPGRFPTASFTWTKAASTSRARRKSNMTKRV